jgi:hypothetical protein
MGVKWRTMPVDLGGLDAKSDPKSVLDGSLQLLENGQWDSPGAISKRNNLKAQFNTLAVSGSRVLEPDYAFGPVASTPTVSVGKALSSFRKNPVFLDGNRFYHSDAQGTMVDCGPCIPMSLQKEDTGLPRMDGATATFNVQCDVFCHNGVTVYASTRFSAQRITISIMTNNGHVRYKEIAAVVLNGSQVRLVQCSVYIYVIFTDAAEIKVYPIDTSNPLTDASVTATGTNGVMLGDAIASASGSLVYLAYYLVGVPSVRLCTINTTPAIAADILISNNAAVVGNGGSRPSIGRKAASDEFCVVWPDQTNLRARLVNNTPAVIGAEDNSAPAGTVNWAHISIQEEPGSGYAGFMIFAASIRPTAAALPRRPRARMYIATFDGAGLSVVAGAANLMPVSKPLIYGTSLLFYAKYISSRHPGQAAGTWNVDDTVWFPTTYLCQFRYISALSKAGSEFSIQGRVLEGSSYDHDPTTLTILHWPTPCNFATRTVGSDLYYVTVHAHMPASAGLANVVPWVGKTAYSQPDAIGIVANFEAPVHFEEMGRSLFFTGGHLWHYDGKDHVMEAGFHRGPDNLGIDQQAAGTLANADYDISAIYVWKDTTGRMYRSAPAKIITRTIAGAPNSLRITVYPQNLGNRRTEKQWVVFYVSDAGGGPLYEVGFQEVTGDPNGTTTFDHTTPVTGAEPTLYTTGGVVANFPPPSPWSVQRKGTRLMIAGNDGDVHYTQEIADGICPAEFAEELVQSRSDGDYNPFHLAEMDGNLFAFGEAISAFTGEGPALTALGNSFSSFQKVASDVSGIHVLPGATPEETDKGIYFWSGRGISLLDRSLQVRNIGVPVETEVTPRLWRARGIFLLSRRNQVWFVFDSFIYVHDYLLNRWSKFTCPANLVSAVAIADLTTAEVVYLLDSAGKIYRENPSTFHATDVLKFRTGWIRPAGYVGEFRVRQAAILGDKKSNCTLEVKVYFDYSDTAAETHTLNVATPWTTEPDAAIVDLNKQRCTAVSFEVYESGLAGTYEGLTITGMQLEIGMAPDRLLRMPAAKRM